ncbi:hypothetical protein [Endozoicomonas sp. ALC020]|uniref:hypothetical protein n=1 Tax=unclassified Endozoicomonas TaxID=2644528 RepID=UPI003BAE45EE
MSILFGFLLSFLIPLFLAKEYKMLTMFLSLIVFHTLCFLYIYYNLGPANGYLIAFVQIPSAFISIFGMLLGHVSKRNYFAEKGETNKHEP